MTPSKAEKWKRLFESKGWLVNDVVAGREGHKLRITIAGCCDSPERSSMTVDTALVIPELDLLCFDDAGGTVFFDWEDIVQVRLVPPRKRKGWL